MNLKLKVLHIGTGTGKNGATRSVTLKGSGDNCSAYVEIHFQNAADADEFKEGDEVDVEIGADSSADDSGGSNPPGPGQPGHP